MRQKAVWPLAALVAGGLLWSAILARADAAWQGAPQQGQRLYARYCTVCHGSEGRGTGRAAPYLQEMGRAPRDHTDAWYMNRLSEPELYRAISEGRRREGEPPFMPWWGHTLTEQDIWDLVAFIRNTTRATPFYYKITGLWGALEGSILLWEWILALFSILVVRRHRREDADLLPYVLSVLLGVSAFFLSVAAFVASPFERIFPAPAVVLIILGIAASMSFSVEKEGVLQRGEGLQVGRYWVQFERLSAAQMSTHTRVEGTFQVYQAGHQVAALGPAQKFFPGQQSPISRAVLRTTLRKDLYLILAGFQPDGSAVTVKALLRPMVVWMWIGGVVMSVGTLLVLWPYQGEAPSGRRRRGGRPSVALHAAERVHVGGGEA